MIYVTLSVTFTIAIRFSTQTLHLCIVIMRQKAKMQNLMFSVLVHPNCPTRQKPGLI
jgi:hypothetical protein